MQKTTIKSILMAAGVVVLSVATAQASPFRPSVINISGDSGGRIGSYVKKVNRADRRGTMVQFKGRCDSACTLYLALPRSKTCIAPGAKFRFHRPTGGTAAVNREGARYLMRQYPGWVRSWIANNGGLSGRLITMDYAYASQFLKPCVVETKKAAKTRQAAKSKKSVFAFASIFRKRQSTKEFSPR